MNKELENLFQSHPEVKLVYLFGSQATGNTGPLSDYDFALYLDPEMAEPDMFDLKFIIQDKLSRKLKTDKVDLIILNLTRSPELKYNIIKDGRLIFQTEPYRVIVEPKILNIYFDFIYSLRKYNLTKG